MKKILPHCKAEGSAKFLRNSKVNCGFSTSFVIIYFYVVGNGIRFSSQELGKKEDKSKRWKSRRFRPKTRILYIEFILSISFSKVLDSILEPRYKERCKRCDMRVWQHSRISLFFPLYTTLGL